MYGINSWFYRKSINQVLSLEKHTIKTGKKNRSQFTEIWIFVKFILQFYLKIFFFFFHYRFTEQTGTYSDRDFTL